MASIDHERRGGVQHKTYSTSTAGAKKKKYRSDGTPIWEKRHIDGPGVWVSCVKGKERQAVSECCDLFESVAEKLWPLRNSRSLAVGDDSDSDDGDVAGLSIEAQIASEVSALKRPKSPPRFVNCQTNTQCISFISCKSPVDPVQLITTLAREVEATGVTGSRYIHRLVPVAASCVANLPEIQALCRSVFTPFFARDPERKYSYKIELRIRNHSIHSRPVLIQHIAQCVPEGHIVALDDPQVFILAEVFKSVFGVAVVQDYYRLQKFNLMEIATLNSTHQQEKGSRVPTAGQQEGSRRLRVQIQ